MATTLLINLLLLRTTAFTMLYFYYAFTTAFTTERPQLLAPHGKAKKLLINVGVYGRVCDNQGRAYSKSIEAEVLTYADVC
jgi:hypothetical protein